MIVNISATLIPTFLEMQRENTQPSGPVFFTNVPSNAYEKYSGVERFQPLDGPDGQPQYLDPKLPRDPTSLGINDEVNAMFEDVCDDHTADGRRDRQRGLLLGK